MTILGVVSITQPAAIRTTIIKAMMKTGSLVISVIE